MNWVSLHIPMYATRPMVTIINKMIKQKNMNIYNPEKHNRKSIRLNGYDYTNAGLYFITICCQEKICRFGKIENGEMFLLVILLVCINY